MQIKLAIIFFKHVFQRGHKIIPLAHNDAAAADIQTLMKFYTFTRLSRIFRIRTKLDLCRWRRVFHPNVLLRLA